MRDEGPLVIIMSVGQVFLAWGCVMQSFASLYDLHCNRDGNKYRDLCRTQAFFIITGLHLTISTYVHSLARDVDGFLD